MATELFKLVMDAQITTETIINPEIHKYFYKLNPQDKTGNTLTIPAGKFTDDGGNPITELTTVLNNNGYYLLFINGVLQQSSLYTVSTDGSKVEITNAASISNNTPIVLVVNNFVPTSTSTIDITT